MATHATGTFEVKTWDEKTYDQLDSDLKLNRASVTQIFKGDIEGSGAVEYLLVYSNRSNFVGLQRINGSLAGRSGSFVLQVSGVFENDALKASWSVVAGSGTGELASLRGEGTITAPLGTQANFTLDYDLDS